MWQIYEIEFPMLSFLKNLRNWFLEDISRCTAALETQMANLQNEMSEVKVNQKTSKWQVRWQAVSAIGSVATVSIAIWMLCTIHRTSQKAAEHDIRAKEIEHEARARIGLQREGANDVFAVVNYGKIPIEKSKLLIQYYELTGTNGIIVGTVYSDLGRFHPDDPQRIPVLSPLKSGLPEKALGFAMALICGDQTFMEKKPFETEVFIWLFNQRAAWVKESETLGNITDDQQRSVLRNAIPQFRSINKK